MASLRRLSSLARPLVPRLPLTCCHLASSCHDTWHPLSFPLPFLSRTFSSSSPPEAGEGSGPHNPNGRVSPTSEFQGSGPPEAIPADFFSSPSSSLSDEELHSLILNRDVTHLPGLPPLAELRSFDREAEERRERRERERRMQEEQRETRVQKLDDFGRAYATGRRKSSVARVWIKEGEGHVAVNRRPHDVYFPEVEWRAQLLQPFAVTETVGEFDVEATVVGGGRSGQAGALRLGISRALQLYNPDLRPVLKAVGYLTRDSRVVERKKPGKAKARKSFQWVKR